MANVNTLSDALEITLKEGELQDVTIEIAETIGDTFLNDGLLRDIPILGSIVGLGKGYLSIRDALFTKKMIYFLKEISKIPKEKRLEEINKIELSKDYQIKVGEKILYIIDKSEDSVKAGLAGKLFCAFLQEKLTYDEFLRCNRAIENLLIKDVLKFLDFEKGKIRVYAAAEFIHIGLMEIVNIQPRMVDMSRSLGIGLINEKSDPSNLKFKAGESYAIITELGFSLQKALN